jgi:hypothetical protein
MTASTGNLKEKKNTSQKTWGVGTIGGAVSWVLMGSNDMNWVMNDWNDGKSSSYHPFFFITFFVAAFSFFLLSSPPPSTRGVTIPCFSLLDLLAHGMTTFLFFRSSRRYMAQTETGGAGLAGGPWIIS